MRGLSRLLASAVQPRNIIAALLLGLGAWGIAVGLLPVGPRPSVAEVRLAASLTTPTVSDRNVSRIVAIQLRKDHLSKHPLDDEISRRGLDLYLKSLDGMKQYFYQADIDEFNQRRNDLDDMVRQGDLTFAYTVFQRLLKRVDERIVLVNELLEKDLDLTADEVLITDPDKLNYPATPAEAKERWLKRLKFDVLMLKADKSNKENPKERLRRRYASFAKRMHQMDSNELLETFLTAVTSAFDPHSNYMAPVSHENFAMLMSLQLEGIGAQLKVTDGFTVIDKLIAGGPADKNGQLKAGDRVVSVGQNDEGDTVDVGEMKLNDVVKLIRGRAGSTVRLTVIPEAGGEPKVIKIVRAKIELKDQEARGQIIEEGRKADGTAFKLGVINLPSFYMDMRGAREGGDDFKSCTRDVKRILDDFTKKGVDAVVLDLRKNGGGSLTEAISLTGLFIEQGPVVQVKDPDGQIQSYDDTDRGIAWRGPLVMMISKLSASASEILAGAIQDYHRGLVVGDSSSHGKGTVQTMMDIGPLLFRVAAPPDLGSLKLTVQQFYRPNGDSTQLRGVLSDIVLPAITDKMDISERDLDYPVTFDKVAPMNFQRYDAVNANVVSTLKEKSSQRIETSAEFEKSKKNIQRYEDQKAKKQVPLNEQKFMAQRAELDADQEDEKLFEEQASGSTEVMKRTFYENEVLAITMDYLRLLGKDKVAKTAKSAIPN